MMGSAPAQSKPLEARLSAMVMDNPNSFLLGLKISNISIKALLDSGTTHCFIDSSLVSDYCLLTTSLPQPMCLQLFNDSMPWMSYELSLIFPLNRLFVMGDKLLHPNIP